MKWIKKGLIYSSHNEYGWIKSHAQCPTVLVKDEVLRVYFSPRPKPGTSCIAMMDVDIDNPKKIIKIYDKPVLECGNEGEFDEHGVMPQSIIEQDGYIYMIYAGWSRRASIPYSNWTGLAVSSNGGITFKKCYKGPILDRTKDETISGTELICIKKDSIYYGFYAKGMKWSCDIQGKYNSSYEIVRAATYDFTKWETRESIPIFSVQDKEAVTCPAILEIDNLYHMWFCYRGVEDYRDGTNAYRIGYAWSKDLDTWYREDAKAGIDISESGWDSLMMAYPYTVKVRDKYYMFYNGNGFGQAGFGYAELDLD